MSKPDDASLMSAKSPPSTSSGFPAIRLLKIERFRGIRAFTWLPDDKANVILGGGDVGKTTILEAIALLLSPSSQIAIADTDYFGRCVEDGFLVEAVIALPADSGIDYQLSPSWPWEWNGSEAVVPVIDSESTTPGDPVYRLRVSGTADLELTYEIVQPDTSTVPLGAALRRAIGLVRLAGEDRNDRDLRLVHGSALDRLLSDQALRSRITTTLAAADITDQLHAERRTALADLDKAFAKERLPQKLRLSIIGGQGASIASMVGITAEFQGVQLPLTSWGAGTRRLSALAIAKHGQSQSPIMVVDEVERGLEPYRQSLLIQGLQARMAQSFATTHSPFVIAAGTNAAFWYVDHTGRIGALAGPKVVTLRANDPGAFLARLTIVAEGDTEAGFAAALLERSLGERSLDRWGIYVCSGGSHETTLELLEELSVSGLQFGGFADNEVKHPTRWQRLRDARGDLLFRWTLGCTEQSIIPLVPDDKVEALIEDPAGERTGERLRTLAERLGTEQKNYDVIADAAGKNLREFVVQAATGTVPPDATDDQKRRFKSHGQRWFKSLDGGRELEGKLFSLGVWPQVRPALLPFCNAVRRAMGLGEVADLDV